VAKTPLNPDTNGSRLDQYERRLAASRETKNRSAPTATNVEPLAYRVRDATIALGIGTTSLYGLIKTGALKPIRIAGRTLIPATEIRRRLAAASSAA
jgi:hypothetical protein